MVDVIFLKGQKKNDEEEDDKKIENKEKNENHKG